MNKLVEAVQTAPDTGDAKTIAAAGMALVGDSPQKGLSRLLSFLNRPGTGADKPAAAAGAGLRVC